MKVAATKGYLPAVRETMAKWLLPALQADYQSSSVPAVDEVRENADVPTIVPVTAKDGMSATGSSGYVSSSAGGSSS